MLGLLLLPAALQALAMLVDELVFHRKRGLPRWERLGHPLDTLTAALCYGWLVAMPVKNAHALGAYVALCAFSCLFITKDELVHARLCEPLETWLHALLFVLHPVVFLAFGVVWYSGAHDWIIKAALGSTLGFLSYQVAYWSWRGSSSTAS
ncbi:MAG TPA: hypothetical protein VHW01_02940 [Polyangiaceae bacterium]|nr:hypothetical protein [Polyangiaceae bacterium]